MFGKTKKIDLSLTSIVYKIKNMFGNSFFAMSL
jgi:hypothetical protein